MKAILFNKKWKIQSTVQLDNISFIPKKLKMKLTMNLFIILLANASQDPPRSHIYLLYFSKKREIRNTPSRHLINLYNSLHIHSIRILGRYLKSDH